MQVASVDLATAPMMAGRPVYAVVHASLDAATLRLVIDSGDGAWSYGNASSASTSAEWGLYSVHAVARVNGTLRLGVEVAGSAGAGAKLSGLVLAPIGANLF